MTEILVNTVAYDWFTVVSNDDDFYSYWRDKQKGLECGDMSTGERWLKRFDGDVMRTGIGSLFVGSRREPVGYLHVAVITGWLADMLKTAVVESLDIHNAWLTRVDIQATVKKGEFDMFGALVRLEKNRKRPELHGDRENGRTIYIGSRRSERFARLYEKLAGKDRYLRLEFQFSGQQARSYGRSLRQETITPEASFRGAVQQIKDSVIEAMYLPIVEGYDPQLPRVAQVETKTDSWLCDTVYPVVMRRLMAHDGAPRVRELFGGLLNEHV